MKQPLIVTCLMLLAQLSPIEMRADVEINEVNFPDAAFRSDLRSLPEGKDGLLTDDEIVHFERFTTQNRDLQSLKGIEYLTGLVQLEVYYTQVRDLDLTGNAALIFVECSYGPLNKLNAKGLPSLKYLVCDITSLSAVDVTDCIALEHLVLNGHLTTLDLTTNTALKSLSCSKNTITTLLLPTRGALERIECFMNNLEALDVSNCSELSELYCEDNQLSELDVSGCPKLKILSCDVNRLTDLDVSNNKMLEKLTCYQNLLTRLDLTENTGLSLLWCCNNLIRGEQMDAFVASLPQVSGEGLLYIVDSENMNEQNYCTKAQVEVANSKNWKVFNDDGVPFEGYDDEQTGIVFPKTNTSYSSDLFSIVGCRLRNPYTKKGIYIQNGRKVVIR